MATPLEQVTLYDTDYNLWVLETVKQLEKRDFDSPFPLNNGARSVKG